MTIAQDRARREWCKGSNVARNYWWMGECAIHGETSFNSIIQGCEACARERLSKLDNESKVK
jgi:hypothetical protein